MAHYWSPWSILDILLNPWEVEYFTICININLPPHAKRAVLWHHGHHSDNLECSPRECEGWQWGFFNIELMILPGGHLESFLYTLYIYILYVTSMYIWWVKETHQKIESYNAPAPWANERGDMNSLHHGSSKNMCNWCRICSVHAPFWDSSFTQKSTWNLKNDGFHTIFNLGIFLLENFPSWFAKPKNTS